MNITQFGYILKKIFFLLWMIGATFPVVAQDYTFKVTKDTDPDPTPYLDGNGNLDPLTTGYTESFYGTFSWAVRSVNEIATTESSKIIFEITSSNTIQLQYNLPTITRKTEIDGINIINSTKVTIIGTSTSPNLITFSGAPVAESKVHNLHISANYTTGSNGFGAGLSFFYTHDIFVTNCLFSLATNTSKLIRLLSFENCENILITNNKFGVNETEDQLLGEYYWHGINIIDECRNIQIGNNQSDGNVILNCQQGIQIAGRSSPNVPCEQECIKIQGNFIGETKTGLKLGYTWSGIDMSQSLNGRGILIGGDRNLNEGNVIHTTTFGILFFQDNSIVKFINIYGNDIDTNNAFSWNNSGGTPALIENVNIGDATVPGYANHFGIKEGGSNISIFEEFRYIKISGNNHYSANPIECIFTGGGNESKKEAIIEEYLVTHDGVILRGSSEPGDIIEIYETTSTYADETGDILYVGRTQASGSGQWQYTLTDLQATGKHYLVTATDANGNTSAFLPANTPIDDPIFFVPVTNELPPPFSFALNFTRIDEILTEGITDKSAVEYLNKKDKNTHFDYVDGLGRVMQQVDMEFTPDGKDIVQPIVYDEFGRQSVQYLPYAANNSDGSYQANFLSDQASFYITDTDDKKIDDSTTPYAQTHFEASPLNRVLEQGAPGEDWQIVTSGEANNKTIKNNYRTNTLDEVRVWEYDPVTRNVSSNSFYDFDEVNTIGVLSVTETEDEHNNTVTEYKDKQGKIILKKVEGDVEDLFTYYVYDNTDNLQVVIPPQAWKWIQSQFGSGSITLTPNDDIVKDLCFTYGYDERQRMITKQVPGAKVIYMIYDQWDRLVLTQDGNQRPNNEWIYTKYDVFNRPVVTGMVTLTDDLATIRNNAKNPSNQRFETLQTGGILHGYTDQSFPTGVNINDVLTVTYYDNYDFLTDANWDNESSSFDYIVEGGAFNNTYFARVNNQITGTKTKVLTNDENRWLKSVNYYDDRYQLIQNITENYQGGKERLSTTFDFRGKAKNTKRAHHGYKDITIQEQYTYDHRERSLETHHQLKEEASILWQDLIGVEEKAGVLTKTAATNTWNTAGAASVETIPSGENGWAETVVGETNTARMFGLSESNPNAHYNTIDYAIYLAGLGRLYIYENGSKIGQFGFYNEGDIVRVERKDGTIFYKRNGEVFYTSTVPSSSSLLVDVALNTTGSTIGKTVLSSASAPVNDKDVILVSNQYNVLGELVDKSQHSEDNGSTFLQSIDYRYNIRGWLQTINKPSLLNDPIINPDPGPSDLFGMELLYQKNTANLP